MSRIVKMPSKKGDFGKYGGYRDGLEWLTHRLGLRASAGMMVYRFIYEEIVNVKLRVRNVGYQNKYKSNRPSS